MKRTRDEAVSSLVMRMRRTDEGRVCDEEKSFLPPLKLRKTTSNDWSVVFKVEFITFRLIFYKILFTEVLLRKNPTRIRKSGDIKVMNIEAQEGREVQH